VRLNIFAKKLGMLSYFKDDGVRLPVTLLEIIAGKVIDKKSIKNNGYESIVIGSGVAKRTNKPLSGVYKKLGVEASKYKYMKESRGNDYAIGQEIGIDQFSEGQYIDIVGTTIGKGFSGVMKRHNFAGLEATHGVSVSHRSHGSTGGCQDPGRVWKNKRMAGQFGNVRCTQQNLKIVNVDKDQGLLCVLGSVPGHKGAQVMLSHAIKKVQ
jgi:large subunit ribosomal protein L3